MAGPEAMVGRVASPQRVAEGRSRHPWGARHRSDSRVVLFAGEPFAPRAAAGRVVARHGEPTGPAAAGAVAARRDPARLGHVVGHRRDRGGVRRRRPGTGSEVTGRAPWFGRTVVALAMAD